MGVFVREESVSRECTGYNVYSSEETDLSEEEHMFLTLSLCKKYKVP